MLTHLPAAVNREWLTCEIPESGKVYLVHSDANIEEMYT